MANNLNKAQTFVELGIIIFIMITVAFVFACAYHISNNYIPYNQNHYEEVTKDTSTTFNF